MKEATRDAEAFYNSLREHDRTFVRGTVERLKIEGFDVYATGSSLERKNYGDVDILITPTKGMTHADSLSGLERVTHGVRGIKVINKISSPLSINAYDAARLFNSLEGNPTYMDSPVKKRVEIAPIPYQKSGVKTVASIDIVLTDAPFSLFGVKSVRL